jgi:hypothetical protein
MKMSDQLHAPAALPPGKELPVPISLGYDPMEDFCKHEVKNFRAHGRREFLDQLSNYELLKESPSLIAIFKFVNCQLYKR